jgi:(2R)-3-sulfolactate dehydrogenase (NADP+)
MVETLAAGLTGSNWSLDAPSFSQGALSPGVGLFVFAIQPNLLAPDFPARLAAQLDRLHSKGIHIPGRAPVLPSIDLPVDLLNALEAFSLRSLARD